MLPENVLSSTPVPAHFVDPAGWRTSPLVDYELAGVAHLDTSQGMQARIWRCWYDQSRVLAQPAGGATSTLFLAARVEELALAFDQNMRWSVAYTQDGMVKLRWFDSVVGDYVITEFPGCRNPRLTLDDKRPARLANSDLIFAYLRDDKLCIRQQRDRFGVEYILREGLWPDAFLRNIGMSQQWRMQFELV